MGDQTLRVVLFENVSLDSEACTDGLDNDGDSRIDSGSDPGCAGATDTSELSDLECDNGQDDDADTKIDRRGDGTGDPHCIGLLDDREAPNQPGPGCGLGPELLLLAPLLSAARRRSRSSGPQRRPPAGLAKRISACTVYNHEALHRREGACATLEPARRS